MAHDCTVYASLNLSARVDKSSIYYCGYCTVTVQYTLYTVQSVQCTLCTVYDSLNLSARVDKSSIYYCEYLQCTLHSVQYTLYNTHNKNGTLIDLRTEIQ